MLIVDDDGDEDKITLSDKQRITASKRFQMKLLL